MGVIELYQGEPIHLDDMFRYLFEGKYEFDEHRPHCNLNCGPDRMDYHVETYAIAGTSFQLSTAIMSGCITSYIDFYDIPSLKAAIFPHAKIPDTNSFGHNIPDDWLPGLVQPRQIVIVASEIS